MSKATIEDVQALGFSASQFGDPPGWGDDANGYVALILADVAADVSDTVGASAYAAATEGTLNHRRIRRAEAWLAAAELWRRRRQFIGADVSIGRDERGGLYLTERECEAHAERAAAQAWSLLGLITGASPESGVRTGYVQTGPFSAVTP